MKNLIHLTGRRKVNKHDRVNKHNKKLIERIMIVIEKSM